MFKIRPLRQRPQALVYSLQECAGSPSQQRGRDGRFDPRYHLEYSNSGENTLATQSLRSSRESVKENEKHAHSLRASHIAIHLRASEFLTVSNVDLSS